MHLSDVEKELHLQTAKALHGAARRQYMARVAATLGHGGARLLERELGWSRTTIRKGTYELASGFTCVDDYAARGRHRAEERLPQLLEDIRTIADHHSQADPRLQSTRLYLRLSAASVWQQLRDAYGYAEDALPSQEVIRQRLNALGYTLRAVKKVNR